MIRGRVNKRERRTEIHSQADGNNEKFTNVHAQYRAPKCMVKLYAQVASLLNTAGKEDNIIIRSASIFVNGGPITTGGLITAEDLCSPKARQFIGKYIMDIDCIVTLFAAISKD